MQEKQRILSDISVALESGKITREDLRSLMKERATHNADAPATSKLSAVDVMFYIAGIVLYAAIAALVSQVWDNGPAVRILLTAGTGAIFWAITLFYIRLANTDDIRRGITNSLLLTGSLLLITGGFIIANEYANFDDFNFYASAITFALLGTLHISFGWQIRRNLLLLTGILLSVAAFPSVMFGILEGSNVPMFVNCLVVASAGGLLAYATRVVSRLGATTQNIARVFDSLSAFTILMSLYAASYDDTTGLLWLLALIVGIIGLFYLSITSQNKLLLGNGSFFLVLSIITISFRYFSSSPAISLLISAAGLLGTAIMAAHINRRYLN